MPAAAEPAEPLEPGDRVVFVSGPFTGYEAVVDRALGGAHLVRVLVTVFDRPALVEVPARDLRRVSPLRPGLGWVWRTG